MAPYLLRSLRTDMLLLWDRNFLSYTAVAQVIGRGAHLLARVPSNRIFEPIRVLSDGSYVAKMYRSTDDRQKDRDGILVRIIEYTFDDPGRPGAGQTHRLLTTLLDEALDPAAFPAGELASLYRQRWHCELDIRSIKSLGSSVLKREAADFLDVWRDRLPGLSSWSGPQEFSGDGILIDPLAPTGQAPWPA